MGIKYISLTAVIMFATAELCSCSSGIDDGSNAVTTIIFIFLFLGASLCSAFFTFKLRRKKNAEEENAQDDKE